MCILLEGHEMIRTGIFEIQRVLKLLYYEALLKNKTKSTININKPYKRWRLPTPEITLSYIISSYRSAAISFHELIIAVVYCIYQISELFSISTWGRRCHHALSCMLKRCSWVYIIPVDGMVKHQSGKSAYPHSFILILIFLCPRDRRSGGILFLSCLSFCHSVIL